MPRSTRWLLALLGVFLLSPAAFPQAKERFVVEMWTQGDTLLDRATGQFLVSETKNSRPATGVKVRYESPQPCPKARFAAPQQPSLKSDGGGRGARGGPHAFWGCGTKARPLESPHSVIYSAETIVQAPGNRPGLNSPADPTGSYSLLEPKQATVTVTRRQMYLAPPRIKSVHGDDTRGYVVTWEPVPGAAGYVLSAYSQEAGEQSVWSHSNRDWQDEGVTVALEKGTLLRGTSCVMPGGMFGGEFRVSVVAVSPEVRIAGEIECLAYAQSGKTIRARASMGALPRAETLTLTDPEAHMRPSDEFRAAIFDGDLGRVTAIVSADPKIVNHREPAVTPLELAISRKKRRVLRFLLDHGADVNLADGAGQTPLFFAASCEGDADIVELLLKRGARVEVGNRYETPLHHAACFAELESVRVLLRHGANPNAKDSSGHTPLDQTRMYNRGEKSKEVASLLKAYGATYSPPRPPETPARRRAALKATIPVAEQRLLDKDGMVVGAESFRQCFDPYVRPRFPVFVTTDSLLNGYHVLFEESVRRLEEANARRLGPLLTSLRGGVALTEAPDSCDSALVESARQHALAVLDVALRLLGSPASAPPGTAVIDEAALIERADGVKASPVLGLDIDYALFQPRGFYSRSEPLERYYRAVRWLQTVPFRRNDDKELLAFDRIAAGLRLCDEATQHDISQFLHNWADLVGAGDDPTLSDMTTTGAVGSGRGYLESRRASVRWRVPAINDQVGNQTVISLRILPSARTPDEVFFQQQLEQRRRPEGSQLCRAVVAAASMPEKKNAHPPLFQEPTLYSAYLRAAALILSAPSAQAPPFMKTEAWKTKSRQTFLGGWAQLRHTWDLQTKMSIEYGCLSRNEPGYVEPNADFYSGMGGLVARSNTLLSAAGALEPPSRHEMAQTLRAAAQKIRRAGKVEMPIEGVPEPFLMLTDFESQDPEKQARSVERLADTLEAGEVPEEVFLAATHEMDLRSHWRDLAEMCRKLKSLSLKQLAGEPFNKKDRQFLEGYGEKLAGVMLYGGNSYVQPRDDAPRIATFCSLYQGPGRYGYLHAGIGRPRALYVLYPGREGPVLCQGAIMPYYEFTGPQPLSDQQWIATLDAENPKPLFYVRPAPRKHGHD